MPGMEHLDTVIAHWPFVVVAVGLALIGAGFFDRVFTREAAYIFDAKGNKKAKRPFWYGMRESLPLHPIAAGFLIGCFMASPEPGVTTRTMIICYFTGAGVAGLVLWIWIRSRKKEISMPGEGSVPPSGSAL